MDSRFYDSKANFKCYHNQGDSHIVFAVPVFGYGRPQMIMDVLKGKDGNMLTVVQSIKTGEVVKENPENIPTGPNLGSTHITSATPFVAPFTAPI